MPVNDKAEIVLDLSRLLSRIHHPTPTGVDRVEMAYARELLRLAPERLAFGAVHPFGIYGRLPRTTALRFLDWTESRWESRQANMKPVSRIDVAAVLLSLRPRRIGTARTPRVFLQSSPHHLHNRKMVERILRRESAKFLCLLHDLIPIEYPEYARPGGAALHLLRVETVAQLADAVIGNSEATLRSFAPYLTAAKRDIPVRVAHLGLSRPLDAKPVPHTDAEPYFLCLGTIEPRKNHLLLLHMWRAFAQRTEKVPRLILVGRRGWENENIVDLLDRCPALRGHVEERQTIGDGELRGLLARARALLMPSFAEGYGLPVIEALDAGVPVICSDLPALREAGGAVPEYLDPLDGAAWVRAIEEYASPNSSRRGAQLTRLAQWRAPSWTDHIRRVLELIERLDWVSIGDRVGELND